MDLSETGLLVGTALFVNDSLCSHYRWLWSSCKKLNMSNKIYGFYTVNGTIKVKHHEGDLHVPITHKEDLKKLVPGYDFSKK